MQFDRVGRQWRLRHDRPPDLALRSSEQLWQQYWLVRRRLRWSGDWGSDFGGRREAADRSAGVGALRPPRYAPELVNVVSMYDTMYDIFVRFLGLDPGLYHNGKFQPTYKPNRESEIAPILIRPNLYQYVAAIDQIGRKSHAGIPGDTSPQFLQGVEKHLRSPADKNKPDLMPLVAGDNPLSSFQASNYSTFDRDGTFHFERLPAGRRLDGVSARHRRGSGAGPGQSGELRRRRLLPGIEMTWTAVTRRFTSRCRRSRRFLTRFASGTRMSARA